MVQILATHILCLHQFCTWKKLLLHKRVSFCKHRQVSGSVSVWEGEGCSRFPWDTVLVLVWQQQRNGSHLDRAPPTHQTGSEKVFYRPDWVWRNILRCHFPAIMHTPNPACWNWTAWSSHCCFRNMHSCALAARPAKTSTGCTLSVGRGFIPPAGSCRICAWHTVSIWQLQHALESACSEMHLINIPYVKDITQCVWMQVWAQFCVRSCLPFYHECSCERLFSHIWLVFSFTLGGVSVRWVSEKKEVNQWPHSML